VQSGSESGFSGGSEGGFNNDSENALKNGSEIAFEDGSVCGLASPPDSKFSVAICIWIDCKSDAPFWFNFTPAMGIEGSINLGFHAKYQ
jgi:hypothetical protein